MSARKPGSARLIWRYWWWLLLLIGGSGAALGYAYTETIQRAVTR